jgi:DNA-binding transcriptional MerR regulator
VATFYQIGEVCHRTGLTPRALHYYDEIGLLVPSERLTGGQRLYTAADLERIERIKSLKLMLGLSLSEIKRLLDADEARARYLNAAETSADPVGRRKAVESALRVTEEQLQSVREKVQQLGKFQRQLERQVRELRRLAEPAGPAGVPAGVEGHS